MVDRITNGITDRIFDRIIDGVTDGMVVDLGPGLGRELGRELRRELLDHFPQVIVELFEETGVVGGGGCCEFKTEWAWTGHGDGSSCNAADCPEESCDVTCRWGGGRRLE